MPKKRILVVTDNGIQYRRFVALITKDKFYQNYVFVFNRSFSSAREKIYEKDIGHLKELNIKEHYKKIIQDFDLVISLHCKQFFPPELVHNIKCINIHPGYNPINRGWYPQVFAINYENEVGATIHEIDDELDHGGIIAREKCPINPWDTSLDVYERILELEMTLLGENLPTILSDSYTIVYPEIEGNLFLRKDFKELCQIHLEEEGTFGNFLNRLRALTHGNYKNAFFIDEHGNKIYLSINLEKR